MEILNSGGAAANVVEAGDQDFEAKVLQRSQQIPVLVDFWAPWCGPCKTLGPTLEKLAGEMPERFELVKVNLDENPMLAQALRIQSIPAVMLIVDGQIRDQFMGAYPEPEIRSFLDHHLPPAGAGAGAGAQDMGAPGDEASAGLQAALAGDVDRAELLLQKALADDPRQPKAQLGMGYVHIARGELEQAQAAAGAVNEAELDKLPDRQELEKLLSGLRSRIFLLAAVNEPAQDGGELEQTFRAAAESALRGDMEAALEGFLGIVRTDRDFRDDGGRKGMLAVFDLLPAGDPLLMTYRSKLSNILFS